MTEWKPIETAPKDRFILLFDPERPRWAGNMEIGRWFGDEDDELSCVWSCGGPNAGLELSNKGWGSYTHWAEQPDDPPPAPQGGDISPMSQRATHVPVAQSDGTEHSAPGRIAANIEEPRE